MGTEVLQLHLHVSNGLDTHHGNIWIHDKQLPVSKCLETGNHNWKHEGLCLYPKAWKQPSAFWKHMETGCVQFWKHVIACFQALETGYFS